MNLNARHERTLENWWPTWCRGQLAGLTLLLAASGICAGGSPDPVLPAGEQAIIGSYRLDNLLLAPGKLVLLPTGNPVFEGMGDTLEQASRKRLLNAQQLAVLQRADCTMTLLADHSFWITNLPSADLSRTVSLRGTWSMAVYHVFERQGYRIQVKCESKDPPVQIKFFNADQPNPPILQIFYSNGTEDKVMFRFANTNWIANQRPSGAP